MNDYMTLLHKHKINGGFLAPDRIPMEERNKNEMILELQNEVHTKDKEIERLNNIINEFEKYLTEEIEDYEKQIKYHKRNKDLRSGILDLVGEYEGEKVCFEDMLGKLQELKGVDK